MNDETKLFSDWILQKLNSGEIKNSFASPAGSGLISFWVLKNGNPIYTDKLVELFEEEVKDKPK